MTDLAAMTPFPRLTHFRIEVDADRLVHLVFDMAGSAVNILTDSVIDEFGATVEWFAASRARGLVISSGKSVFCTGGDLTELGAAYDRIGALPVAARFDVARMHFGRMGRHLRRLERCGKPVAVAIGGLALGGGCELALACHYRVLADCRHAALGLPEVMVGLLPGAGGTQRLPRLISVGKSLPMLLEGARLSSSEAMASGIADAVVAPGDEIVTAKRWLRSAVNVAQPWDRADAITPVFSGIQRDSLADANRTMLARTHGNLPAPIALFTCLEQGLDLPFDEALDIELAEFSRLIQRAEPRNMIRTLFIGAQDYARHSKTGTVASELWLLSDAIADGLAVGLRRELRSGADPDAVDQVLARLGFGQRATDLLDRPVAAMDTNLSAVSFDTGDDFWFQARDAGLSGQIALTLLASISLTVAPLSPRLTGTQRTAADYVAVRDHGYPAWIGGPFAWIDRTQSFNALPQTLESIS
jgi:3-hydroxyacyl-CoA dehydrogenase/enoyl-CoA hydratase/3-hydroxybutyryl-CoA epimerase